MRSRIESTLLDKTNTSDGAPYLASKCRWRLMATDEVIE